MRAMVIAALALPMLVGCQGKGKAYTGGESVHAWIEAVHDPEPRRRRQAVFKLGNVGPSDPAILPALLAALRDPDPRMRREAILAILKCGPDSAEAVALLDHCQHRDPDAKVRAFASKALAKIRPEKVQKEARGTS